MAQDRFFGKVVTGNHRFSQEISRVSACFSLNPKNKLPWFMKFDA
jgi:hypothetical protein